MYKIKKKNNLCEGVVEMYVHSPEVARSAKPGQFIILRVDKDGERIPLTIAGYDKKSGDVRIIFQVVGVTTEKLSHLNEGDYIQDFVGPLGNPTQTEGVKKVCIIGGGVGCAISLPLAQEFHTLGANVTSIIGFRNKSFVILEDEFKKASDRLEVVTDDGSYSKKGNVTVPLKEMLEGGEKFDLIIAIGPIVMMRGVTLCAKPYNIPVTVSMNPIMIDGTGMCGGCRLTLNTSEGKVVKFACVDGPDFNGYEVDFDDAILRGSMYKETERERHNNLCNLYKKEVRM